MKNNLNKYFFLGLILILGFASCKNDSITFPDYETQAVYFPIQYPIRTLVLGEDRLDNSIDLQHAFNVGVSIGGMYENKNDWRVDYKVDSTLLAKVEATDMSNNIVNVKLLPANYYSIIPTTSITIPQGSFTGLARVQLTDAFFNDPNAYKFYYVLPLSIVSTNAQSILSGIPASGVTNPNPHNVADYLPLKKPKNFTIFGIKYINPWHGTFFHRGVQIKNAVPDKVFHAQDLEKNTTTNITTSAYKEAIYTKMGAFEGSAYASKLTFSDPVNGVGDVTVSSVSGSTKIAKGTGKYYKSTTDFARQYGSWLVDPKTGTSQPHLTITLNFTVTGIIPSITYQFLDTIVFRDNGVKFENYKVGIKQ